MQNIWWCVVCVDAGPIPQKFVSRHVGLSVRSDRIKVICATVKLFYVNWMFSYAT